MSRSTNDKAILIQLVSVCVYASTITNTDEVKDHFCNDLKIKNSGEVLSKLKCRGFRATSLSTYDFSTLYTTLPHNLIKEKLLDLIEWTFKRAKRDVR